MSGLDYAYFDVRAVDDADISGHSVCVELGIRDL